eukprot:12431507-Karenia_brevis.AAC.2
MDRKESRVGENSNIDVDASGLQVISIETPVHRTCMQSPKQASNKLNTLILCLSRFLLPSCLMSGEFRNESNDVFSKVHLSWLNENTPQASRGESIPKGKIPVGEQDYEDVCAAAVCQWTNAAMTINGDAVSYTCEFVKELLCANWFKRVVFKASAAACGVKAEQEISKRTDKLKQYGLGFPKDLAAALAGQCAALKASEAFGTNIRYVGQQGTDASGRKRRHVECAFEYEHVFWDSAEQFPMRKFIRVDNIQRGDQLPDPIDLYPDVYFAGGFFDAIGTERADAVFERMHLKDMEIIERNFQHFMAEERRIRDVVAKAVPYYRSLHAVLNAFPFGYFESAVVLKAALTELAGQAELCPDPIAASAYADGWPATFPPRRCAGFREALQIWLPQLFSGYGARGIIIFIFSPSSCIRLPPVVCPHRFLPPIVVPVFFDFEGNNKNVSCLPN